MNGRAARRIRRLAREMFVAGLAGEHPVTGEPRTARSLARRLRKDRRRRGTIMQIRIYDDAAPASEALYETLRKTEEALADGEDQ